VKKKFLNYIDIDMNKEQKHQRIRELQKEAKLLRLDGIIKTICYHHNDIMKYHTMNEYGYYNKNGLIIQYHPDYIRNRNFLGSKYVVRIENKITVFEAYETNNKKKLVIDGFIPGEWVKEVQKLGKEAIHHKKEAEDKEEKRKKDLAKVMPMCFLTDSEEERKFKKFGL